MTGQQPPNTAAVLAGGRRVLSESSGLGSSATRGPWPDAGRHRAAEPIVPPSRWPAWARPQLAAAVALAQRGDTGSVALALYRDWFNPPLPGLDRLRVRRPLAGVYRAAHAGSAVRVGGGELPVVGRHDVIGTDGWWRTWGEYWTPPRQRPGSVRVLFSPDPDRLADFVHSLTAALLRLRESWSLGCATNPRRARRYAAAVLDLPALHVLPIGLLDELAPLLRPAVPPLCLPIAPGVAVSSYPDNGMTFGEHRCHLIATALRHPSSSHDPLRAIAAVFTAHGIDPAQPYR